MNIYQNKNNLITKLIDDLRYNLEEAVVAYWFVRAGATKKDLIDMGFEEEDINKAFNDVKEEELK